MSINLPLMQGVMFGINDTFKLLAQYLKHTHHIIGPSLPHHILAYFVQRERIRGFIT